jgi:hypothetical protein
MRAIVVVLAVFLALPSTAARAADELVTLDVPDDGTPQHSLPYILTTTPGGAVAYGVIGMPGGAGNLDLRMDGSRIAMNGYGSSFLIRSRSIFSDPQFVVASTDSTGNPVRMLAIVHDLERRYGKIAIYVMGTSSSTIRTMSLAATIDGQVAGFVHTSSMPAISGFDPRKFKSRNLLVYHRKDACQWNNPWFSASSHRAYGTEEIVMEGGQTIGDNCYGTSYHQYNGIERETVDRIKAWIVRGR